MPMHSLFHHLLLFALICTLLPQQDVHAQSLDRSVLSPWGRSLSGSNIMLDATAGQPVASALASGQLELQQGFQQALPRDDVSRAVQLAVSDILLFPNPARGYVQVQVEGATGAALRINLHDAQGRVLICQQLESLPQHRYTHTLELDRIPAGLYLMEIILTNGSSTEPRRAVEKLLIEP